jgi:hypothetical protein
MNHKNSNKNKTDQLNGYDVMVLYAWLLGYRGNRAEFDKYWKIVSQIPLPTFMKKRRLFTTTRLADGICTDCNKPRCNVCNGCPVDQKDLETAHCQRCICSPYEEQGPLNNTGVPLSELVRKRQGAGFSKNKKNGGSK